MENHSNFNTPLLPISAKPPENPNPSPSLKPSFAGNYLFILLGPFMSLCIYLFVDINGQSSSRNMLAILSWVFDWWLTEAVPMPIASMAPLFLFPMFGVASADAVARSYMNDVISLMLGSFILALAVEHYNIHRRLALNVTLIFCGDPLNPPSLLLGVCSTTAFISMWMQNTAAAAMMMPVAKGILQGLPPKSEMSIEVNKFCKAVILGVTYSAAIGGMSTLTGTGVNLILVGMWGSSFPEEMPIGFSTWFLFGFPLALLLFLALWGLLCLLYLSNNSSAALSSYLDKSNLKRELELLGPMDFAEKIILFVFSVMMATLLFMLPNKKQQGEKLMDWNKCKKLPWNIILLLGAGFAIADGVLTSGLAGALSAALSFLRTSPQLAVTPLVCMVSCTITEFTSNSATATLVIPLLIQLAKTISIHPFLLMVPGAIGAQFAFLLPTGTPSNVVGFSTGHIGIMDMIMVGLPLKMIGVGALSLLLPTLGENLVNSPCKLLQNLKDL